MKENLIRMYQEMADLTKPKCAKCRAPHYCCNANQCEATIRYAATEGVMLTRTDHPDLPLLEVGGGCSVAPHLRPICSVHVCEHHLWNERFARKYYELRDAISTAEIEARPEIYGPTGE